MEEVFVRQVRDALMIVLLVSAPPLGIALLVGLIVNILQTITQIQEQTLSYVPKIIAVFLVLLWCLPWMIAQVVRFTLRMFELMRVI